MPSDRGELEQFRSFPLEAIHPMAGALPISEAAPGAEFNGITASADARLLEFCQQHNMLAHAKTAKAIAEESFPARKALRMYIDDDPEEDGSWILFEVATDQEANDFIKDYNRCILAWAERIPTEALALMRLSFSFA